MAPGPALLGLGWRLSWLAVASGGTCRSDPFVQHASTPELCARKPPFGLRQLCAVDGMAAFLRSAPDPDVCSYATCAVVGASSNLVGARYGTQIDRHDAVIRVNQAPAGNSVRLWATGAGRSRKAWQADLGVRTTWRVMNVEVYSQQRFYPRRYLAPPVGRGSARDMSAAPREPRVAFYCIIPAVGRCSAYTLRHTLDPALNASAYMLNPALLWRYQQAWFGAVPQMAPSTGMAAVAMALAMCGAVTLYGFGNGSCAHGCYHYYEDCHDRAAAAVEAQLRDARASEAAIRWHRLAASKLHARRQFKLQRQALVEESTPNATGRNEGVMHNFAAQARTLLALAAEGRLQARWGMCAQDGAANRTGARRWRRR